MGMSTTEQLALLERQRQAILEDARAGRPAPEWAKQQVAQFANNSIPSIAEWSVGYGDGLRGFTPTEFSPEFQQAETQRQNALRTQLSNSLSTALSRVNSQFAPYGNKFFDELGQQYANPYLSQLQAQRAAAEGGLLFTLARQGLGQSSAAGDLRNRIAGIYNEEAERINKEASDFVNRGRASINQQRTLALDRVNNAAGNQRLLSELIASPSSVVAPQLPKEEVRLGDVFTNRLSSSRSLAPSAGSYGQSVSSAQAAATGPSYGGAAAPTFRAPVRGEGKSFFAK